VITLVLYAAVVPLLVSKLWLDGPDYPGDWGVSLARHSPLPLSVAHLKDRELLIQTLYLPLDCASINSMKRHIQPPSCIDPRALSRLIWRSTASLLPTPLHEAIVVCTIVAPQKQLANCSSPAFSHVSRFLSGGIAKFQAYQHHQKLVAPPESLDQHGACVPTFFYSATSFPALPRSSGPYDRRHLRLIYLYYVVAG